MEFAEGVNVQAVMPSVLRALHTYGLTLELARPDAPPLSEIALYLGSTHPIYEVLGKKLQHAPERSECSRHDEKEEAMADLTGPSERYQDSYLEALQEFQAEGKHLELSLEDVAAHFGDFVQCLREQADLAKIKPGRVPHWVFWLIDGNDYIGRLILRTEVNAHLLQIGGHIGYEIRPSRRRQGYGKLTLKYGLEQAKAFGLERVLLTCDEDNLGSRRIIESHRGMLENIIEVEQWPAKVCHYWIQL